MSGEQHYSTPPSTYNEPAPGYNCAQCVTVASSYSYDPLKTQCSESCKNVKPVIQDCIMSDVRKNKYIQAQSISCVNQPTISKIPVQECKTLCIDTYSHCINASDNDSKCKKYLSECQLKCQ